MGAPDTTVALTTAPASAILFQALQLPEPDRIEMAYQLLKSLEPQEPLTSGVSWEASWKNEIDARLRIYEEGKVEATPWPETIERMREALRRDRP